MDETERCREDRALEETRGGRRKNNRGPDGRCEMNMEI